MSAQAEIDLRADEPGDARHGPDDRGDHGPHHHHLVDEMATEEEGVVELLAVLVALG